MFEFGAQQVHRNEITLYWQILLHYQPSSISRHTLYRASQRLPIQGIRRSKVIFHSNTRFTLYWRRIGLSSPIQGDKNSGYHSNSRYPLFLLRIAIIKYKVFTVLHSVYFPIQDGNILQFEVAFVLGFGCTISHPKMTTVISIQGCPFLAVLHHIPIQGDNILQFKVDPNYNAGEVYI